MTVIAHVPRRQSVTENWPQSFKGLLKFCLATGCRATRVLSLAEQGARGTLSVLCYHRVVPNDSRASCTLPFLAVAPSTLQRHCRALRRHYDVLPLYEAVQKLDSGVALHRPLAAITFDDGYRDNFRFAAPILDEAGIRATFFVIAGLVAAAQPPWYDRLGRAVDVLCEDGRIDVVKAFFSRARSSVGRNVEQDNGQQEPLGLARSLIAEAKRLPVPQRRHLVCRLVEEAGENLSFSRDDFIMDWQQLTSLAERGHEVGCHSATHELLPQLDDASLDAEVAGSLITLEKNLGRHVRSFSYPNGDVDPRVAQAVRTAGYHCAVTTEPGVNKPSSDAYHLKRWFIHEDRLAGPRGNASDTLLRMEICGLADRVFRRRRGVATR